MSPAGVWALALTDPGGLTWSAPQGCPTQDDVAALLAKEAVPEGRRVEGRDERSGDGDGCRNVAGADSRGLGPFELVVDLAIEAP